MQNTRKDIDKDKNKSKKFSFAAIGEKLRDKDEVEVRSRLRFCVDFALTAAISYMLGGAKLLFSAYPLCISLLCSSKRRLLPVLLGLTVLILSGGLPGIYIFTCLAAPLIRILVLYLPFVFKEAHYDGIYVPPLSTGALIEYDPKLPEKAPPPFKDNKKKGRLRTNGGEPDGGTPVIFDERLSQRALSAAISGILTGLFLLIGSNFSFYSLFATFFLTAVCPMAVLFLDGYFGRGDQSRISYLIALAAIGAGCVYVAKSMTIIGMPMAPFLAMTLTLCATSVLGLLPGGIAAIALGLILDPVYMPLLLICSLLFFLISAVRHGAGLAAVCAAVVIWCYYIGGTHALVSILPPMLLAIPVFMITDKYREIMCAPYNRTAAMAGGVYFAEAVTEKNKNMAVRERLGALSEIFSTLSETFYKLSDKRRRPDALGLKKICESCFDDACSECRNRELCYGEEYPSTLDAIGRITSALHTKGIAAKADLPSQFLKRCLCPDRLIDSTNRAVARATESMIKNGKFGLFASSYEDINEILRDALENDGDEYKTDRDAAEKIFDLLYEHGFRAGGVVVYGKRCKNIVIKGIPSADRLSAKKADLLRRAIEDTVKSRLCEPCFELSQDGAVMRLTSKPILRARCAHGNIAAEAEISEPVLDTSELYVDPFKDASLTETVCGDTSSCFITSSSYFYSLISDGMGNGEEAAFVSGVCSMFIEKMLSAGNRADITVRMLNNVLRNENMCRGGECSATVDLCELDLLSGTASFIKSGAAPTYIAREGTVYKVYSRTMPIGILKDTDTRISKFDTQSGDIIIMLSDGCCPDSEDCAWLVEFLCEYMAKKDKNGLGNDAECTKLKDKLLSLAVKSFPEGKPRDDISVSVVMIE